MVLELIQNTNSPLEFKYIKDYMLSEIKKLDDNINESKDEIKENMKLIDNYKEEYKNLVSILLDPHLSKSEFLYHNSCNFEVTFVNMRVKRRHNDDGDIGEHSQTV